MSNLIVEKPGDVEMTAHRETVPDTVGSLLDHVLSSSDSKATANGLACHLEAEKTAEEIKAEERFVRKVDFMILPLLAIMYFLASMDRGDIGFAAAVGMTKQLDMTSQQLSTAVSLFFVGYIVFQLPGDLFLRVITPPIQLGLALMCWGTFTASMAGAKSYSDIAGLRFGVGIGEAFLQAGNLYLTFGYKRNELATRGAWFFATAALAGAFNGIIAYGILENLNGACGLPAWKWIFLIEGVISIAYGFLVLLLLPPAPERIRWGFTKAEKEIAVRRTREAYNVVHAKINVRHLLELLKDPKTYFCVAIYCAVQVDLACFSTFLPVIIRSFGYSTLHTQLFTIPVFLCGSLSTLAYGYTSDRYKQRGIFLISTFVLAAIGWIMLLASPSAGVSLAGCFFISIGTYPMIILVQSWMNSNFIGFTKRAGILAAINMVGQCFAIIGSEVYSDAPKYYRGNGFALGAVVIGAGLTGALRVYLRRKNAQRVENRDSEEARRMRTLDIETVGDAHPDFVYYL